MQTRVLSYTNEAELAAFMQEQGVTPAGIKLMSPKAQLRTIFLSSLSTYAALILKQEALSIGADLACPKDTLCLKKKVNCVLIVSDKQILRLLPKLQMQSPQLQKIAQDINNVLANDQKQSWNWKTASKNLKINKTLVMGIVNATDDSFSGDGVYCAENSFEDKINQMVIDGVDIFDVGGESTRPFAPKISKKQEIERVIPVIKYIKKNYPKIAISIDTYKAQVARQAIDAGATIINDISGLRSKAMRELVAESGAGVCIMHMQGTPQNMQKDPKYDDVISETYDYFQKQMDLAEKAGIDKQQIVLDVGIGFGKRLEDNLKLIKYHQTFKSLGRPLLLGVSRKSFIGSVLNEKEAQNRVLGSSITHAWGIDNGASILRVHDIKETKQTIAMYKAIVNA